MPIEEDARIEKGLCAGLVCASSPHPSSPLFRKTGQGWVAHSMLTRRMRRCRSCGSCLVLDLVVCITEGTPVRDMIRVRDQMRREARLLKSFL